MMHISYRLVFETLQELMMDLWILAIAFGAMHEAAEIYLIRVL